MTTPTMYNLATDYTRFGLIESEAQRIIGNRFEWRDGKAPQFVVLHIQAGTTKSSLDWWANGPGIQASATVMIQHDGSILKIVPEQHGPWTNGDDANPTPNGQRLVNLPGNSNLYTLSIEAEGRDGSDTTPAQLDAIEWQVRDWMARYNIPVANVIRHADVNSVTRPNCPGAYYPEIMRRISVAVIEPYPITWEFGDVGPQTLAGYPAVAFAIEVTAKKPVKLRKGASAKETVGREMRTGEKAIAYGVVRPGGTPYLIVDPGDGKPWRAIRHAFTPATPVP